MFKKILVATTPRDDSSHAVHEAIALAKMTGATLMLLHVLSPMDEGYPAPIYPIPDAMHPVVREEAIQTYATQWEAYERTGLETLKTLLEMATTAGVAAEFTQNLGDPGHAICDLAKNWEADLIVLGRRGRSGLSELFLGSVSNYVLHHAHCSVLTIQNADRS